MAHTPSSRKRIRTNAVRHEINRSRVSRIRTFINKVEKAIAAGEKDAANEAFKVAVPEMNRGVTKGVLHKNTVARKMSRLSSRVKAIG